MTAPKRKKQHYVAQSILERFTTDGERLFVYDKHSDKSFPAHKRDIAQENFFYDIPNELMTDEIKATGVDPQIIESYLGKIDRRLNQAIHNLINLPKKAVIPTDLRKELAFGIAYQILRTRDYRNLVVEGHTKLYQALSDDLAKTNFPDASRDIYPKVTLKNGYESVLHMQHLVDPKFVATMTEILYSHIWIIGTNQTVKTFYTSDNPVVKHHTIKDPLFTGWKSPGVEIAFPLTPRLILLLCDRLVFKFYKKDDGKRRPIYVDNVVYYNSLQVIHSHRQLYSCSDAFSLAEEMCNEKPNLRNPVRDRVDVNIVENPYGVHFLDS